MSIVNDLPIYNNCIQFLCSLPSDENPIFSTQISKYADLHPYEDQMLLYVLKNSNNFALKFNAFYTLMVIYRKQKNFSKSEKLSKEYYTMFKRKPLFLYQMSNIHKNRLTKSDALLAINYAREAIKEIELTNYDYPGFYQNFSDVIALSYDNNLIIDPNLLEEGIISINKAITINPNYAKYYYTLGRLLTLKNEFSEAKKNILHAIDLEDSTRKDFSLRIAEYQDALVKCSIGNTMNNIQLSISTFEKNKKELEQEFERMRNSVIEFVGFFAAIIALVITSVQIATTLTYKESIGLIGFLIGGIIIASSCLRLALNFTLKSLGQMILIFVIGMVFILITFYYIQYVA